MASGSRRNRLWVGVNLAALFVLLVLSLSLREGTAAKQGGQQQQTAAEKKKLEHLAARGPVVTLADGNFTRFADVKPTATRPYHLVLLFTALAPQYKCVSCRMMETPFSMVATAYAQQFDIRTAENKVVFARIDIDKGSTTFQAAGVQTAPRVFLVPAGKSFPTARNLGEFEVTQGLARSDTDVDDFLHDLGAITGAKVVILPDTMGLLPGVLLMGFVLGFVAHFFADVPSRALAAVRHKGLWFAVSMGCYMTGVGGMIYCIIRNPKPHGFHQETGRPVLFNPAGREQYWYEGVVVAVFYLLMSAAILGIYLAAGWKRVPSSLRTAAVLACVTVLCYLSSEYMALYVKKTSWYALGELLPPLVTQFHQGPLKRKHGLLRRLVRLSHLWLNEYAGFRPFCAKLKTLLLDYVVRRLGSPFAFK